MGAGGFGCLRGLETLVDLLLGQVFSGRCLLTGGERPKAHALQTAIQKKGVPRSALGGRESYSSGRQLCGGGKPVAPRLAGIAPGHRNREPVTLLRPATDRPLCSLVTER